MHSEPQQPDTETPTEKPPKFKNTKKSNGCLIAALIMVMILILPPLLLLGFCAVLSGNPRACSHLALHQIKIQASRSMAL